MSLATCPYCKYDFHAEDIYYSGSTDFPTERDGDESETKCSSCKKPLSIVLDLTPSWRFVDDNHEEIEV